jgi:hypothetical protein
MTARPWNIEGPTERAILATFAYDLTAQGFRTPSLCIIYFPERIAARVRDVVTAFPARTIELTGTDTKRPS